MGIFGLKQDRKTKKAVTAMLAQAYDVPVDQVKSSQVTTVLAELSNDRKDAIAKYVDEFGEEKAVIQFRAEVDAYVIPRRVIHQALAQAMNVPARQVEGRKVEEIVLSLDKSTRTGICEQVSEHGEDMVVLGFRQQFEGRV